MRTALIEGILNLHTPNALSPAVLIVSFIRSPVPPHQCLVCHSLLHTGLLQACLFLPCLQSSDSKVSVFALQKVLLLCLYRFSVCKYPSQTEPKKDYSHFKQVFFPPSFFFLFFTFLSYLHKLGNSLSFREIDKWYSFIQLNVYDRNRRTYAEYVYISQMNMNNSVQMWSAGSALDTSSRQAVPTITLLYSY